MHIAFFLQRLSPAEAPRINPVTGEVIARLRERGARVDLLVAEDQVFDIGTLRPAHDLYVLKSKSPLTLSVAAILADAGAAVVNSVDACRLVRDKIVATALLAAAGVPVPASWATADAQRLRPLLGGGPLWLKPQAGSKGRGVRRVSAATELCGRAGGTRPWTATRSKSSQPSPTGSRRACLLCRACSCSVVTSMRSCGASAWPSWNAMGCGLLPIRLAVRRKDGGALLPQSPSLRRGQRDLQPRALVGDRPRFSRSSTGR